MAISGTTKEWFEKLCRDANIPWISSHRSEQYKRIRIYLNNADAALVNKELDMLKDKQAEIKGHQTVTIDDTYFGYIYYD